MAQLDGRTGISVMALDKTTRSGPHRYKMIYTTDRTILVRDDGRQIDRMIVWPDEHGDCGKWERWASYGDNGMDASVADELFRKDRL